MLGMATYYKVRFYMQSGAQIDVDLETFDLEDGGGLGKKLKWKNHAQFTNTLAHLNLGNLDAIVVLDKVEVPDEAAK